MTIGEPRFRLERLGPHHDRASFRSRREPMLEAYLVDDGRALRENARAISAVYLLIENANDRIAGYFTIANATVVPASIPKPIARKLPTYDRWPAVKLGRMARHDEYAGQGIGPILVARAFAIALEVAKKSATFALLVDAKNPALAAWYASLGFQPFTDAPLSLFILNRTMREYVDQLAVTLGPDAG